MAVKSFQGPRAEVQKKRPTKLTVEDIMTSNVICFTTEQTIHDVMKAFIKNRISGGPVVNDQKQLIGIISEGDCIQQISESRYYNLPISKKNTVGKAMVKKVETINADMNIFDAAKQFLTSKRRRFPILKNGKLIGLISQKDVLKAAMQLKGNTWK